jgi:hypothetical protein
MFRNQWMGGMMVAPHPYTHATTAMLFERHVWFFSKKKKIFSI